jgi:hypothetical protein
LENNFTREGCSFLDVLEVKSPSGCAVADLDIKREDCEGRLVVLMGAGNGMNDGLLVRRGDLGGVGGENISLLKATADDETDDKGAPRGTGDGDLTATLRIEVHHSVISWFLD